MSDYRSLAEITQKALRLLYQELGIVNTVRFLNQFTAGFGNYTEGRRAMIEDETLEDVWSELQRYQAQRAPREQDTVATYG